MKNTLFTLFLWLFAFTASAQQSWQVVGQPGFSEGMPQPFLFPQSLALDNNGIPYVAYAEYISEEGEVRGVMKKFENNTWQTIGDEFYENSENSLFLFTSLAFDSSNIPYIAYRKDEGVLSLSKAVVKKLENGNWQYVGQEEVSTGDAQHLSTAFNSNDILYILFKDGSNSGKATVMKFENNIWQVVGEAGFSAGAIQFTSLAFDSNDVPYVIYSDEANNFKATVMKFENNSWLSIGDETGVSTMTSINNQIFIGSDNIPCIAYRSIVLIDNSYIPVAVFKKYINNEWQEAGELILEGQEITASYGLYNDIPYIVYTDWENDGKATVKKFENNVWQVVGEEGFSEGIAHIGSFDISNNGIPYVAFHDNTNNKKVTVMKYDSTMSVDTHTHSNILLYPNPANDFVTIDNIPDNATIKVFDIMGKLIYSTRANKQIIINTECFSEGIYLIQFITNQQTVTKKLVINKH